ncbi:UDP-Glycosyltransferase/glycogen phosphorylase [Aspergillus uvarum CBS 121591]|uniref:UDP-Glycosyltransferase/glycogen phosphorylase n=1 Tax=Aspergillus uvarum CBS 121591 TaxID=1448315 RepID=A0A319CA65_9EURO|nr:UDP-Glycosyltransferase/glycogen phosphorylase [Aspergillus uvarum CBS 121591]PYH81120.1 UDP-Glycosyltransferase/glycogen phosphorylase [Aspergillus uvarum CBS 121591]
MDSKESLNLQQNRMFDDYSDPPPAYSPARASVASSEASLWTIEPDFPPEFTNDSRELDYCFAPQKDGKFGINADITSRTSAFIQAFMRPSTQARLVSVGLNRSESGESSSIPSSGEPQSEIPNPPPLDVVVMVVDESIDPFISIAKQLQQDSHRVRIAADVSCASRVRSHGLDFFAIPPISSAPRSQRAADGRTVKSADNRASHPRNLRYSLFEAYKRCWQACIAPYQDEARPFMADAIIATPTAHAHIHCAERLSIPLHIMSATPQSPTKAFPHPRARLDPNEDIDRPTANILSYAFIEESTWRLILEPLNIFRRQVLGLMSISPTVAGRLMIDQEIPHTYFSSRVLVPKPRDWALNYEMSGYIFHEPEESYRPPKDLDNFISSGAAPIHLTMRDTSMLDSDLLATVIQENILSRGLRIVVSEEWRHVCAKLDNPNVYVVNSSASDWLLPRVSLIIHNGSIDATKTALRHGKPSVVIAETDDHLATGQTLAKIGAAASPLRANELTSDALSQAIAFCLRADVQQTTRAIQRQLLDEAGAASAIKLFYRRLPPQVQPCSMTKQDVAMYQIWNRPSQAISAEAAAVLLQEQRIKLTDLVLISRCPYNIPSTQTASERPAKDYWNGFSHAAKDIVSASDLVSKVPGLRKKDSMADGGDKPRSGGRPNLAKDVGVGTARFFGNIALLPFTSTALVVNSVAYGVKSVKAHRQNSSREEEIPTEALDATREKESGSSVAGQAKRDSPEGSSAANQIQLRNEEHVEAICRRHLDRGFRNDKIHNLEFRGNVVDVYESF